MQMLNSDDDWITQAEAARLRGVSRQAINKLIKSGRLKTICVGGIRFVSSSEIKLFVPAPSGRKKL